MILLNQDWGYLQFCFLHYRPVTVNDAGFTVLTGIVILTLAEAKLLKTILPV